MIITHYTSGDLAVSSNRQLLTGLLANFAGQGISAISNFAFIPVYIALLGIEAYGLIGVFTVVLTAAALLDAGMTPTLNREMASFRSGQREVAEMRNLLFSVLTVGVVILVIAVVLGSLLAPLLARSWLPPTRLDPEVVRRALMLMIVVATLRVVEGMLRGVLLGLQRPVVMNVISSLTVLARAGGVLVPLLIRPSVVIFFLWQAAICFAGIVVLATIAMRSIGSGHGRPLRFDGAGLYRLRGFAGGVMATSLIALILGQADKVVLVKLTSLETFGYYAVASAISAVLYQAVLPISQAYYPHFTIRMNEGDHIALQRAYHQASQLVAVLILSIAAFVVAFAPQLLLLWSGKVAVATGASPLLRVLIVGSVFHCLMYIPYMLQLSAGWSRLAVYVNSIAACIYLPTLWVTTVHAGAEGAAVTWTISTFLTLMVTSFVMHRRLLRGTWTKWLMTDVAVPGFAAMAAAAFVATSVPLPANAVMQMVVLLIDGLFILLATALAVPITRHSLVEWSRRGRYRPSRNTGPDLPR